MATRFRSERHRVGASDQSAAVGDFSQMAKKTTVLRILVVDDEPLIRWSLAEALGDAGHHIVEVGDAHAALEAVASAVRPFDVVLLDYRLPDSNDLSLLSHLRSLAPASRIIMMTAFGSPEMTAGALALGACRVLTKPFEIADLAALVQPPPSPRC